MTISAIAILCATLCAALSVGVLYVKDTLLNTDGYVQVVSSLPKDPQVSQALGQLTADAVFSSLSLEEYLHTELPPRLTPFAPQFANGIKMQTATATSRFAQSDQFQAIWTNTNLLAHAALMRVARGEVSNEQQKRLHLIVELQALTAAASQHLANQEPLRDMELPSTQEPSQFELNLQQSAAQLRYTYRAITVGSFLLPLFSLIFSVVAIIFAPWRRRALLAIGVSFLLMAGVLVVAAQQSLLAVGGHIASPAYASAAQVVMSAFAKPFYANIAVLGLIAISSICVSIILGPTAWAVALRKRFSTFYKQTNQRITRFFRSTKRR